MSATIMSVDIICDIELSRMSARVVGGCRSDYRDMIPIVELRAMEGDSATDDDNAIGIMSW